MMIAAINVTHVWDHMDLNDYDISDDRSKPSISHQNKETKIIRAEKSDGHTSVIDPSDLGLSVEKLKLSEIIPLYSS